MAQLLIEEALELHLDELERRARNQAETRAELRRLATDAQRKLEASRPRR